VGSVVVKNQVQALLSGRACLNVFYEIAKLDRPVTPMEAADNSAGLGIERSKQINRAIRM
jgi:hypothetical protein